VLARDFIQEAVKGISDSNGSDARDDPNPTDRV